MSYAAAFQAILARHGQTIQIERDGVELGGGLALLRPLLDRKEQFLPTDLGLERQEQVLCMGDPALPFDPVPGRTMVREGDGLYRVVSARLVTVEQEPVYWRVILDREVGRL